MINEKFSSDEFKNSGFASKKSRILAKELQKSIQDELDEIIGPAMEKIIEKLNSYGHNLSPYGIQKPGEKHFREALEKDKKNYKFLVALDVVVSVGYPETIDQDAS